MSWRATAERQHGVITRAQLATAGLTRHDVAALLARNELTAAGRGMYLVTAAPQTVRQRIWLATLTVSGTIGFATASALWGLDDEPIGAVDLIIDPARRVARRPGIRVHRVPIPRSETTHVDGLPVTSRRWTVLDELGRLPRPAAVRLADRALQRRWITETDLRNRLQEFPGRSGNTALRAIAAQVSDGAAATSERILHRILRAADLTDWVANLPVRHRGTLLGVVDVAFPRLRLAIEVDGFAYHHDVDRFRRDRSRQNALVTAGWTVLRFTWADLTERPDYVIATVMAQIVERSAG